MQSHDQQTTEPCVAVIITAKDAADTAATAVRSALAQSLTAEVIFVDDGSKDGTAEVAHSCDDGTGRLTVLRLDVNRGPSYGRNLAIATATAPFFCILDADDFLGEERLAKMFAAAGDSDWDLLADDIVFCSEMREDTAFDTLLPPGAATPFDLDLAGFVHGNLPYANRHRRELGFLKPVIRRDTTRRLGIRYDERLRLGEDVLFYVNFLTAGAKFRVVGACGYYAVQHPNSLSARHRTVDIANLYEALVETQRRDPAAGGDLAPYIRSTRNNLAVREALDRKRANGWGGFLSSLSERPDCVPHVLKTVVRDKLAAAAP